ncbi:auxin response factor 8 isoform X2 [Capsicum chacoense]
MDAITGSSHQQQQQNHVLFQGDNLYSELWKACAGPMMDLPHPGERVFYFPMMHVELVTSSTSLCVSSCDYCRLNFISFFNILGMFVICPEPGSIGNNLSTSSSEAVLKESADQIVPSFHLPSRILCRVINIQLKVEPETDEVYTQITSLPEENQNDQTIPDALSPEPPTLQFHSFCKNLTASDINSNWGLTVRRDDAIKCFPPLDITKEKPIQELIATDLHGFEWQFTHVFQGQPRRHLLTKGWGKFVASKRLVVGDAVIFLRGENGGLRVGIRRCAHPSHNIGSSPVSSQTVEGVLSVVSHAFAAGTLFSVYCQPRMSGCFLSLNKYLEQNKLNISNENSAPVTSNGLYTNQVSVNDLDCDVFSDIFLAPDSHFMKSTLQSNENDAGVACTVQSFEEWPEIEIESLLTYSPQLIPELSMTTSTLMQPTDALQMTCTYSTTSQLSTEGSGCGGEVIPWAGYQVAQQYVPILNRVIQRNPSTISGFKAITGDLQSAYLEMLAKLVNLLEQSTIGNMDSRDHSQVVEQYLADLKFIGIDISWIETRLGQVGEVLKKEKLIQYQHALTQRIEETQCILGKLHVELDSVKKEVDELTPKVGPNPPSKDCSILEGLL